MYEYIPYTAVETEEVITLDSRLSGPHVMQSSSSVTVGVNIRNGSSLPGWRDRLEKGIDASTAYSRTVVENDQHAVIKVRAVNKNQSAYKIELIGQYRAVGQVQPLYATDTETQYRALASIKRQLASRVGNARSMAPLAETRYLARLIGQMTSMTTDFVVAVGNAKRTKGKAVWRFMKESWLGLNFGLRPLVSDVGDLGNAIAEYLARNDLFTRLQSSATTSGAYTYAPSSSLSGIPQGFQKWERSAQAHYKLSYRYIGGFDIALRSANSYSMLDHLGVGLWAIPETLWELTAFSWMVDYFTNIGMFLEDVFYSPPGQTRFLVCDRRYILETVHNFKLVPVNPLYNDFIILENQPGSCVVKYREFQRTPLVALPHIGLYIKDFRSIGQNGISKLLNLIAVL